MHVEKALPLAGLFLLLYGRVQISKARSGHAHPSVKDASVIGAIPSCAVTRYRSYNRAE